MHFYFLSSLCIKSSNTFQQKKYCLKKYNFLQDSINNNVYVYIYYLAIDLKYKACVDIVQVYILFILGTFECFDNKKIFFFK
jgi:hypothetical protein